MSASISSGFNWNNSADVLQGIMGTRMEPTPSSPADLPPDALTTSSELTPDDPSFLGFQFGTDPAVPPHSHISFLNNWSLPPAPQHPDYSHYHPPRLPNDQDAWNPLQVTGVPMNPSGFNNLQPMGRAQKLYEFDCYSAGHYSTPSDDNGSQYNGLLPSDSGYGSRSCRTRSIATSSYAVDSVCSPTLAPDDHEQEDRVSTLDLGAPYYNDVMESTKSPNLLYNDVIKCHYPNCNWTGKCPSDKRKHEARHRKLFKCDEANCSRKEGFGTINDLARHKKCVHKQEPERGPKVLYMCFGQNCPRRSKNWPRLDNFRQHLTRMHADEDVEELLKKSHEWYETCVKPHQIQSSFVDRISEEEQVAQTPLVPEPDCVMRDFDQESCHSIAPNQAALQPSDILTPYPIKGPHDERLDHNFHRAPAQPILAGQPPVELPTLNSLNLPQTLHQGPPFTAQRDNSRNDQMEDMVAEAATTMINAMTRIMNSNSRRQSQQMDDGTDIVDQNAELCGPKKEMLQRILTAALDRLSGNSEPTRSSSQGLPETESNKKDWIQCEFCSKRTRLRCEMKKHKKRHERPYGCTFHRCNKTFGSKADWKRHENSQHFHLQSWRCTLQDPTQEGLPCARLFYRQEIYIQHLKKHHQADDEEMRIAISKNRIGRNGQSQFWCGFCREIIPLKSQGLAAWNERFNHIDAEHFRKGERIGDWLLSSGHLTKDRDREEAKKRITISGLGEESGAVADDNSDDDDSSNGSHQLDSEYLHDEAMTIDQEPTPDQSLGQLDDCAPNDSSMLHRFLESSNLRKRKFAEPGVSLDHYQHGEDEVINMEKRSKTGTSVSRSDHVHWDPSGGVAEGRQLNGNHMLGRY